MPVSPLQAAGGRRSAAQLGVGSFSRGHRGASVFPSRPFGAPSPFPATGGAADPKERPSREAAPGAEVEREESECSAASLDSGGPRWA